MKLSPAPLQRCFDGGVFYWSGKPMPLNQQSAVDNARGGGGWKWHWGKVSVPGIQAPNTQDNMDFISILWFVGMGFKVVVPTKYVENKY